MYSLIKYQNDGIAVCLSKRISTTCRGSTILKPNGRFLVDRLYSHENAEILQQMKKQIEGKSCIVLESRTKNKALEEQFIESKLETDSEKNVKKNTENHTIHDNRFEDDECHSSLNGLSNMAHSSPIDAEYNGRKENEKHTICDTRLNNDECQFDFDDLTNMPHSSPLTTDTADVMPKTSNDGDLELQKSIYLECHGYKKRNEFIKREKLPNQVLETNKTIEGQVRENKKALPDNYDDELLKELKQWNINKRILNLSSCGNLSAESELEEREEIRHLQIEEGRKTPHESAQEKLPNVSLRLDENNVISIPSTEANFHETECVERECSPLGNASDAPSGRKRKPKKKHNCLYCNKLTTTLTRHLKTKHASEPEVIMAVQEAKETMQCFKEKNRVANYHNAFAQIRKQGDEQYNKRENSENIIVVRKSYAKDKIEEGDYIVCRACKGYYSNKNFRNHRNKTGLCKRLEHEKGRNLVGVARVSSLKIPYIASGTLKERIFPHFTKKHQKDIIFYDAVIIAFGNALCTKYFHSSSSSQNYKHISSSLRLLADILIEAKKIDPSIKEFDDLLHSKSRKLVMDAIRQRSKYGEDGFKSPSTALECCNLLAKVATLMQSAALDEENRELAQRYGDFETNMRKQQNIHITRAARENQMAFQRQKLEVLPSTSEIKNLLDVLRHEFKSFYNNLCESETVENYLGLAKALVAYIMVFNRKRPADVHNWQLHEFQEEERLTEEDFVNVPEQDRAILQNLRRYRTRHKLNKNEAILIDENGRKAIKLLISLRKNFITDPKNKYIFAHPKGKRSPIIRADLALKEICIKHHLDISRLKSTKLRKHLATCTASLPRDTQKHLSAFMSHKEDVHFDVYQNRRATDVTVVGRILYHASGVNPEGLNVTTEINASNQSVDELPATATWLNQDDFLDNDQDTISDEENQENIFSKVDEPQKESSNNLKGTRTMLFPIDIALTKKKAYSISLKKKIPDTVSQTWTHFQKKQVKEIFKNFIDEKRIPPLAKIQEELVLNECDLDKSISKIQAWIRAEIKRTSLTKSDTKGWSAEETNALRQYFSNYYKLTQKNKVKTYPRGLEMNKALETIPLLKNKTQAIIRSKLQNEFTHLLQKFKGRKDSDEEEEEILSDYSESAEELDELLSDQSW